MAAHKQHLIHWLHGGLVTRKGGIRRYYIYILSRLGFPDSPANRLMTDQQGIANYSVLYSFEPDLNWGK